MLKKMDLSEFVQYCKDRHTELYVYDTTNSTTEDNIDSILFCSKYNHIAVFHTNNSLIFYSAVSAIRFSGVSSVLVDESIDGDRVACDLICVDINNNKIVERIFI